MRPTSEIAVLIDRSRDGIRSGDLAGLHQDERFRVTETWQPLTRQALGRADVVVIQGLGTKGYGSAVLAALAAFVHRGGGLLLTTSAGAFEVGSGRPVHESAAQEVAGLFGVRFLSPTEAKGKTSPDQVFAAGYRRDDLALTGAAPLGDFAVDDLVVDRALPLAVPRRAIVLLRHRATLEPVAAALRVGRGRVIVAGTLAFGRPMETVGRTVVRWLGATSRRPGGRRLPDLLPPAWRELRAGHVHVRFAGVGRAKALALARTAQDLAVRLERLFARRRPMAWRLEVLPGVGAALDWPGPQGPRLRLGADLAPAALAYELGHRMSFRLLGTDAYRQWLNRSLGVEALCPHLALKAMEWLGFEREAAARRVVLETWPDAPRPGMDPRTVDLGRWWVESGAVPTLHLWQALEQEFGRDLLRRFFALQPKTVPWEAFDWDYVMPLDVLVYYLSLAAKRDLFRWFADRGHTVHRIPLIPVKDRRFRAQGAALLRSVAGDAAAPASERGDALRALLRRAQDDKAGLAADVRRLRSRRLGERLAAAMRLAECRDERAAEALRAIAGQSADRGAAALAALALVRLGEPKAAGPLRALARSADPRFRLDARAALAPRRDPGRSFPPVRVTVRRDGTLRALAWVDGYAVANVISGPLIQRWPRDHAVTEFFVHWVHTSPRWRRAGLSRTLLERSLRDRWAAASPVSVLWTGTTNTAHTLYRSVGFIDLLEAEMWSRPLKGTVPRRAVKGVRLRPVRDGDAPALAALFNKAYRDYLRVQRRTAAPLPEGALGGVAERGGRPVGFMTATLSEPDRKGNVTAYVRDLCVRAGKDREGVAAALAAVVSEAAQRRGAREIVLYNAPEDDDLRRGLESAGFACRKTGGVIMWRLNDLPQLLIAIVPLLEERLADGPFSKWHGTVALIGRRHRAAVRVRNGAVSVLPAVTERPTIALRGSDDAIARLVVGRHTAFQALLQTELEIVPRPTEDMTRLLGGLFPRVPLYW